MKPRTTSASFIVTVAGSLSMLLPVNSTALEKIRGCDSPGGLHDGKGCNSKKGSDCIK